MFLIFDENVTNGWTEKNGAYPFRAALASTHLMPLHSYVLYFG